MLARVDHPLRRPTAIALALLLAVESASWPLATSADAAGVASPAVAWTAWALAVAVGLACVLTLLRRPAVPVAAATAGAFVGALALVAGGLSTVPGYGTTAAHPTIAPAIGLHVGLALLVPGRGVLALLLAGGGLAYAVGIVPTLALGQVSWPAAAANVGLLWGVPLVAGLLRPVLNLAAPAPSVAELTALRDRLSDAEGQLAAAADRERERGKQYRLLHDTVLSTLASLSRGSLDPRDPAVAHRLTADADYLRGLIATTDSAAGMYLVGELARITRELAPTGLRVHANVADVPDSVPEPAVRALADALREALVNVVKHAGRAEAWVTIVGSTPVAPLTGPDGRAAALMVTIADRGTGFDPGRPTRGLGVRESIVGRLREAGGDATIDSEAGQGTSVELRWPA